MGVYDGIHLYTEDDLDRNFYEHFEGKFHLRGFGYWVWKPQIILQTLSQMEEGDLLQYTDVGCHLDKGGVKRLLDYFDMVSLSETGLLAFNMSWSRSEQWTKGDLLDYFHVRDNEITFQSQHCATVLFIKKCPRSMDIVRQWLNVYYDDFSLMDDTPSRSANFKGFYEHRHDQSAWSILARLNHVPYLSDEELKAFDEEGKYPIYIKRDLGRSHSLGYRIKRKITRYRCYVMSKILWGKRRKRYFKKYKGLS